MNLSSSPSMTSNVPFQEGWLDVGDGHAMHWTCDGNPQGPTVVVVHGGPGGAMAPSWSEFFDPQRWQRVQFDQRGCGQSTPFGALHANTLDHLVADMDRLRSHLGVERWTLFGGSWGTTLAMAYGLAFPERCAGFLLRGVWLARQEDMDWFLWDVRRLCPDWHSTFLDAIEAASGRRPRSAADVVAFTEEPLSRHDANSRTLAQAWATFEFALSFVQAPDKRPVVTTPAGERQAVAMALLERHYIANVLPPEPLLPRLGRLAGIPCEIVHGRLDLACSADQAYEVAKAWSGARLTLVDGAGHATFEPSNVVALQRAAERLWGQIHPA